MCKERWDENSVFLTQFSDIVRLSPEPFQEEITSSKFSSTQLNNKTILFFSIFDKNEEIFKEAYKNWLFIIEHYVSKVIKIPFLIEEIKEVEKKEYLKISKITNLYTELKKKFLESGE